jgi:hypothetical protein
MISVLFYRRLFGLLNPPSCLPPAIFLLAILIALPAAAEEPVQPFYSRNQNPFVQIYGLPAPEGAILVPTHSLDARLVLDIANNFASSSTSSESVTIDGETWRTTLALRYGLGKNLEIGLDLPYIDHSGGIFDGLIEGWHDLIGFSQDGRDQVPHGRLLYRYTENGVTKLNINDANSGLGDLLLSLAVPLRRGPRALALRTAVKLPTGSASRLRGSGSTDFSARLSGEDRQTFAAWDITWFGDAGVLLMTKGDVLPDRQRHVVGFGSLGFGWQPLTWLTLKAQLDGHTAFYDSALTELGDSSAQLVLGGTLALPADLSFDVALAEDVIVNTAPDAVFHFMLQRRF